MCSVGVYSSPVFKIGTFPRGMHHIPCEDLAFLTHSNQRQGGVLVLHSMEGRYEIHIICRSQVSSLLRSQGRASSVLLLCMCVVYHVWVGKVGFLSLISL